MTVMWQTIGGYAIALAGCALFDAAALRIAFGRWSGFGRTLAGLALARVVSCALLLLLAVPMRNIRTPFWSQLVIPALVVYPLAALVLRLTTPLASRNACAMALIIGLGTTILGLILAVVAYLAIYGLPC